VLRKGRQAGMRIYPLVCLCVLSACHGGDPLPCNCGEANGVATLYLACGSPEPSSTQTTGACTVSNAGPGYINIQGDADGGACHVDVEFEGGAVFSTDVTFEAIWLACGSDPHGCGPGISATPDRVSVGSQCGGEAGLDGGVE
jgi:hypothetical protein